MLRHAGNSKSSFSIFRHFHLHFPVNLGAEILDIIDGDLGPDPPDLNSVLADFIHKANSDENSLDGTRMILKLLRRKISQLHDFDKDSSGDASGGEQKQDENYSSDEKPSIFHKFSPLCAERSVFSCHLCSRPYGSVRGLNNHIRADHGAHHVDKSVKEIKGTCKLPSKVGDGTECGLKFTTDQVNKHLKTHGISPPPGQYLRGFMLCEDGTFSCLFLRKEDQDPDVDVIVELVEEEEGEGQDEEPEDVEEPSPDDELQEDLEDIVKQLSFSSPSPAKVPVSSPVMHGFTPPNSEKVLKQKNISKKLEMIHKEVLAKTQLILAEDIDQREDLGIDAEREKTPHQEDNVSSDSDLEPDDTEEFTSARIAKKKARHERRNIPAAVPLHELPENEKILKELESYLMKKTIKTVNKNNKGIEKVLGHIGTYKDCLLKFEFSRDESFCLSRNVSFSSDEYLDVKNPLEWLQETEDQPQRCKERLKAHSAYRDFVKYKVENSSLGTSLEALLRKRAITDGLDSITKFISTHRIYAQYQSVENRDKVELEAAKLRIMPDAAIKEASAVSVWNNSQEAKDEMAKYDKLYEDAIKAGKIGPMKFASYAHFCRFNMVKADKQRGSTYTFKNKHFIDRVPMFLPEGYTEFNELPAAWNVHQAPSADVLPDAYQIWLSGGLSGQKGQNAEKITITKQTMELCDRYRELKSLVGIEEQSNLEASFFVNAKNEPIGPIHSNLAIWKLYEKVTGVPRAKGTAIRKGAENLIRTNKEMVANVKTLNNHSDATGRNVYHKTSYVNRLEFVNLAATNENESANSPMKSNPGNELLEKRAERHQEDERISRERAEQLIEQRKVKRNISLSSKCRVLPDDRKFLQELIKNHPDLEISQACKGRFPGKHI